MKKKLIFLSFMLISVASYTIGLSNSAYATPLAWSQISHWFNKDKRPEKAKAAPLPPVQTPAQVAPTTKTAPVSPLQTPTQVAPTTSASPQPVPVIETTERAPVAQKEEVLSPPLWMVNTFPEVAINQKNYKEINLDDYATTTIKQDSLLYSLTPGKVNPDWVNLQPNHVLRLNALKISVEDVDTTQIIYLTATSKRSGQSSSAEITLKITANDELLAPEWEPHFTLHDGIPNQPYSVDLTAAINPSHLQDNDQLIFQLINTSANWLQMDEEGSSLVAKKIPEDSAEKYYEVILRVTSKMSGRSNDFNGKIFVNAIPAPLKWQPIPAATINKNYLLDLSQYVKSNIRNDQFTFDIDTHTLPNWLSIKDNHLLTGIFQKAALLDQPQKIEVIAKSQLSGIVNKTTLLIPVNVDQQLAPQWKKDFFSNPIVDEPFHSDDLISMLQNRYPHDELKFEYVSGPKWLNFMPLCHCLASEGNVPEAAAGQSFVLKLRVYSKASGKSSDYEQSLKVYTGMPQWLKTTLPEVKIAQKDNMEIPINAYAKDDISNDQFTYVLDQFHSPSWIQLTRKNGQMYLVVNADAITTNEVGTTQTVRLFATSQSTRKTSMQLLTIHVAANPDLPKPTWKSAPLSIATVGVAHAMDLNQYIQGSLPGDILTIKLGLNSPPWLYMQGNRLMGTPPRDQIGGPYAITLLVYSQATDTHTIMQTRVNVQLAVVAEDTLETHAFYDNHQSIVIRGLKKNHQYRLFEVKGSHFDYGPFYAPCAIKTAEDWNGNPFYAVNNDRIIETGDDGVVSIVYYTLPTSPPPQFELVILR